MNQSQITLEKIKRLTLSGQIEAFEQRTKVAENGQEWLLDRLFVMITTAESLASELDKKDPKKGDPTHYYDRLQKHIKTKVFDLK